MYVMLFLFASRIAIILFFYLYMYLYRFAVNTSCSKAVIDDVVKLRIFNSNLY